MFVYTFWEPRENIPFYLRLCLETWKKFLPNATIVLLDYRNIGEFLDIRDLGLNLFSGKLTLPQISDAIRIALLAKHGGVWLDIDTIILSRDVEKYFLPDEKHRTIFFAHLKDNFCQMCFINTPPNSMVMNLWLEVVKEKIWNLNFTKDIKWDFVGNSFIDEYSRKYPKEIKLINRSIAMPDKDLISDSKVGAENAYQTYYFFRNCHLKDISNKMLFLQNSWTPQILKQLPSNRFFHVDCTLVNVLAEALGITLPPPKSAFVSMSSKDIQTKKFPADWWGNFFMRI